MEYNFDEIVPRRQSDAVKWDIDPNVAENMLPMWVADMDFKTAPTIIEALQKRVAHGVFGYTLTSDAFYHAIIGWWKRRHGLTIQRDWIVPVSGILPALSAIIRAFSNKEEQVLLLTPVYDHFFASIHACDRKALTSPLRYENGNYHIDFDDFEAKAAQPETRIFMLSNPHNPTGRVWSWDELHRLAKICHQHDVHVVSDEIHADLVQAKFTHIPFASLDAPYAKDAFTCSSPSKPFNLAGIQVGYIFTENKALRKKLEAVLHTQETLFLNAFATSALVAAYTEGEAWLIGLLGYISENYAMLCAFMETHLPQIKVTPLQATYLVWLDVSALQESSASIAHRLKSGYGLWLNAGTMYGEAGEGFLRMNIGCPKTLLKDGLQRLKACSEAAS